MKRKQWQDKVSEGCIRQLEYQRRSKAFVANMPFDLANPYQWILSSDVPNFQSETNHLLAARPEDYEDVDLGEELTNFVNETGLLRDFCGNLVPGVFRMPPTAARIVREFQSIAAVFEKNPELRALCYLVTPFLGVIVGKKIEDIARKSNISTDFSDLLVAQQKGDLGPMLEAFGKVAENLGRALQGKPIPKGKVDYEKIEVIDLIRQNQKEKLTWEEMREALEFGGIHFEDAEILRIFAHRARAREARLRKKREKPSES